MEEIIVEKEEANQRVIVALKKAIDFIHEHRLEKEWEAYSGNED